MTSDPGLITAALACFATAAVSSFVLVRIIRPSLQEARHG